MNGKVLCEDTVFTFPTGDRTAISKWSSGASEGLAVCRAMAVPSVLRNFKAQVRHRDRTRDLPLCSTSHSTDLANTAAVPKKPHDFSSQDYFVSLKCAEV